VELDVEMEVKIRKELEKINSFFINDIVVNDNIGLYTGVSGRNVLMCQNYLAKKNDQYFKKINSYIEYSVNAIEAGKDIDFSFSTGLAGWAWTLEHLTEKGFITSDINNLLEDIDHIVYKQMKYFLSVGEYDQLNGAIGIGRYFIKRKKYHLVDKIINYLNETKVHSSLETKWRLVNRLENAFYYDFRFFQDQ